MILDIGGPILGLLPETTFYRPKVTNIGKRKANHKASAVPSQGYMGGRPVKLVREPSKIIETEILSLRFGA
jgi:hypothetical protein